MKYVSSFWFSLFYFFVVTSMCFVLSGCLAAKGKFVPAPIIPQHNELREVNEQLEQELKTFKQLSAQLQLNLLEKDTEVNRLTMLNEQLINEFVHNKVKVRNRGDKVETVRLLAEVATLIDTAKETRLTGSRKGLLQRAEQYQAESKTELEKGNIDSAFRLADQALELVKTFQLKENNNKQQGNTSFVKFVIPLPMTLLKNSNVRTSPSLQASVQHVMEAGSKVAALGHTGEWVQVSVQGRKSGWIHYTLLAGVRE